MDAPPELLWRCSRCFEGGGLIERRAEDVPDECEGGGGDEGGCVMVCLW